MGVGLGKIIEKSVQITTVEVISMLSSSPTHTHTHTHTHVTNR